MGVHAVLSVFLKPREIKGRTMFSFLEGKIQLIISLCQPATFGKITSSQWPEPYPKGIQVFLSSWQTVPLNLSQTDPAQASQTAQEIGQKFSGDYPYDV